MKKQAEKDSVTNKINLDYDWNSEYGDGDIPRIDKNSASDSKSVKDCTSQNRNS